MNHSGSYYYSPAKEIAIAALWLVVAAAVLASALPAPVLAQTAEAEVKLRERMSLYWDAMEKNDFFAASQYIHPDSRRMFINNVPKARLVRWKIQELKFNDDQTACDTVMIVTRPVAIAGTEIDFPLNNRWVLLEGEWYFQLPWKEGENPMIELFRMQRSSSATLPPLPEPKPDPALAGRMAAASRRITADAANARAIQYGEKTIFRYYYKNETDAPLRILSVHADCHCTDVRKDFPEVPPGGQGTLEVTVDTFGLPLGRTLKEVNVQFSDLPDPLTLPLIFDNVPNFALEGDGDFGQIPPGRPIERRIRVLNKGGRAVRIVERVKSDPRLEFTLDTEVIAAGGAMVVLLRYNPGTDSSGEFLDNLVLRTDLPAEPLITIPIRGVVARTSN